MKLSTEKSYPYWVSIIPVVIFLIIIYEGIDISKNVLSLLSSIISVFSIAIGFLATVMTIMLSLTNSRVIIQLNKIGLYSTVNKYLIHAIIWCFIAVMAAVLALFVESFLDGRQYFYLLAVIVYSSSVAALACIRIFRVFKRILEHLENPK